MKTQQRSLFDLSGTPEPPVSARFLSRRDDPQPSQVAAERAVTSGQAKGDAETIIEVLRQARSRPRGPRGSLTAKEIAHAAGWMLGGKPENVRVSRRMAALEVDQEDKHGNVIRGPLVIATGLRRSFDNEKEQAITSYALVEYCCGNEENWDDYGIGDGYITRTCAVCNEALGVEDVRNG
jgi:hypothetical protein